MTCPLKKQIDCSVTKRQTTFLFSSTMQGEGAFNVILTLLANQSKQ